jgi:hypothetical protein
MFAQRAEQDCRRWFHDENYNLGFRII